MIFEVKHTHTHTHSVQRHTVLCVLFNAQEIKANMVEKIDPDITIAQVCTSLAQCDHPTLLSPPPSLLSPSVSLQLDEFRDGDIICFQRYTHTTCVLVQYLKIDAHSV